MRTFLSCLFAALALVAAPSYAQSDIVKRPVQFAKGKSGATIKGSITGDQTIDYTLRAAAGQTMTVKLSGGSSVNHNVLPPGSTGEALFVGSRDGNDSTTRCRPRASTRSASTRWAAPRAAADVRTSGSRWPLPGGAHKAAASQSASEDERWSGPRPAPAKASSTPPARSPAHRPRDNRWVSATSASRGRRRHGGGGDHATRGRKRVIFFKAGKAVSANLSQADGNMSFGATKEADLYMIRAGNERYEIPEAVIFGG